MKRESVFLMVFLIILVTSSSAALVVERAEASGTIYIRADGSIDPPTAPISTFDNVTYTLTGNIYDSINVDRDNIVVDGSGYALQGSGTGTGIGIGNKQNITIRHVSVKSFYNGMNLYATSNVTILGSNITNNSFGIYLSQSSYNNLSGNSITNSSLYGIDVITDSNYNIISGNNISVSNYGALSVVSSRDNVVSANIIADNNPSTSSAPFYGIGINIQDSSDANNTLIGNTIRNNMYGIAISASSGNLIYHNNIINNINQWLIFPHGYSNSWDNGYPSGGNYWSDYNGTDANYDGIGDTSYVIDANNTDHYPLMAQYAIPEFPTFLILPLFFITTLLGVTASRRKLFYSTGR